MLRLIVARPPRKLNRKFIAIDQSAQAIKAIQTRPEKEKDLFNNETFIAKAHEHHCANSLYKRELRKRNPIWGMAKVLF
jgi:hypothetical protein